MSSEQNRRRRGARWRSAIIAITVAVTAAATAPTPIAAQQAQISTAIRGRVVDATTGRPLDGAHVQVEQTDAGTLTDADGRFILRRLQAGSARVVVNLIGYGASTQDVTVVAGETVDVSFLLQPAAFALDAVVVTGTAGRARQREVGNSIAQIDVAELDEPVASVDQLLQGRTTSITVTSTGASFGAGAAIRLRGNVSATMSNQPLIFVDGVRQSAEAYPLNASQGSFPHYGSGSVMSPLNDINPADIERMEVVKGAAATTLYGSEASAGVIQIFTKKGMQGGATWTFQTDQGVDWVQPFGSDQRPYIGLEPWLKKAYGTRNSLSVRGGVGDVRYFVSGAYDDGDGVLPNDHETRLGLRMNLDLQVRSDLGLQLNTSYTDHDLAITQSGNNGMGIPLNVFRAPNNSFGSSDPEVLSQLLDAEVNQYNNRWTVGFTGNWAPWEPLTQRLTVGLDRIGNRGTQLRPLGFAIDPRGVISDIRWESQTLTLDYTGTLRWLNTADLGSTFSWGAQSVSTDETLVDSYGRGFPGPGRHTLSSTAERFVYGSESRIISGGVFFQNLIGLRDRLFLTLGGRIDGTSTFGEELGLQFYPKANASYVISDEPFWPEAWGQLKLRAAYGMAGRAPGAFDAARTWTPGSFGGTSAFLPGNVGNPHLAPEKTREIEVGFDGSWFSDRVQAQLTWYDQITRDALFNVAQTPSRGFTGSQLENVGVITNEGLELTVDAALIRGDDFGWSIGGSVSTNRSEVLEVGAATSSSSIQVGQPAPVLRGTLVTNADEFAAPEYELNHYFGPNQPTLTLGLNTQFELPYGLRLSARGEYQGGHYINDSASNFMIDRGNGAPGCDDAYEQVPFGEYSANADFSGITALERARCYRENVRSGLWIYPADFFKLRELTLVAPVSNFVPVPGARSATLTLSLRNAWRWVNDDFWAFDPEMVSSRSNVNSLTTGITEHAPAPARFVASLRVVF